jgi:hypothetical protein
MTIRSHDNGPRLIVPLGGVDHQMTVKQATRIDDDRPVLMRALEIAYPAIDRDLDASGSPGFVEAMLAEDDHVRILSHAVYWLADRLRVIYTAPKMPTTFRCGWCLAAAGGTEEAWQALPSMSDPDMKAHTVECQHNPMVVKLDAVSAALDEALTGWSKRCDDAIHRYQGPSETKARYQAERIVQLRALLDRTHRPITALTCDEAVRLAGVLHRMEAHPDYEYETTKGPRKAFEIEPPGDGWERNTHEGSNGWERFEFHEEAYWMRRKATP